MTHPSRLPNAEQLRSQHPELSLKIVLDPDPDGPPSPLRTARRAWGAFSSDATHHLVLQDDALLCRDFSERLIHAVAALPGHAICLFADWASRSSYAMRLAALLGHDWAEVIDRYVPCVGLVLPVQLAHGFSVDHRAITSHDDAELRRYLAVQQTPACVTVPNLVEHQPVPSLLGNDNLGRRRSAWFGETAHVQHAVEPAVHSPAAIPYFSVSDWKPRCAVRPGTGARGTDLGGRNGVPLKGFLADRGCGPDVVAALSRKVLERQAARLAVLSPSQLTALWLTALALGMSWHEESGLPRASLAQALARASTQAYLGTIADSALRGLAGSNLGRARAALADVVLAGVRSGLDVGAVVAP